MQHISRIWPTMKELADDLGVPYSTAAAWFQRGSFPAKRDLDLIEAAQKRGQTLTLEQIAEARRAGKQPVESQKEAS